MKKNTLAGCFISYLCLLIFVIDADGQQNDFIKVNGHQFTLSGKPEYYIGTNYWYGGLLAISTSNKKGIDRLKKELDFLSGKGVTNLRILAGAEGEGLISNVDRVSPPLQPAKGIFEPDYLRGLDILLSEMGKRNMKAVIFLSNNWEWSGGFLQYLNWNGLMPDNVFRRKLSWDENRDYVSKFYSCIECKEDYLRQVEYVIGHTNSITNKKYADDPAIMAWEIANEPRPMRPAAIPDYENWIESVATFIKSRDTNHLLTIGTEGYIGTDNLSVYERIHQNKNIDYLTIHIWPKNWEWFKGIDIGAGMDSVISKTRTYLSIHLEIAQKLNKPLVLEEFGLPRDGHSFALTSTTHYRDVYYKSIFSMWAKSKQMGGFLAGANFWSYGGVVKPINLHWQPGDDYIGDPPMEEQGLNSVFNGDKSTWDIISSFNKR